MLGYIRVLEWTFCHSLDQHAITQVEVNLSYGQEGKERERENNERTMNTYAWQVVMYTGMHGLGPRKPSEPTMVAAQQRDVQMRQPPSKR